MPPVDEGRNRVVTNEEWQGLSKALASYPNPWVAPLACLMLETAMRSCEPLVHLRWGHIQWQQRIIELPDAKAGRRQVPMGPGALHILTQLKAHAESPPQPGDRVFPTTYEAVKKGWSVAREAAGVKDVGLHDLRHTAATRFALEFKGNLPVLMVITGHKTVQMAMRYVNIKAPEVATMMHGEELAVAHSAAGYRKGVTAHFDAALVRRVREAKEKRAKKREKHAAGAVEREAVHEGVLSDVAAVVSRNNVVRVDFGRRAA
jgi:integrase